MTAIAAAFGGGAARDADVRRMLDAAAHRGAQAAVTSSRGAVTLGYRGSRRRLLPVSSPFAETADGTAVVIDGRLDNRDDLRRALSLDRSAPDAAIVLAAWARWSDEAPSRLLGDFAWALWDAPRARLVCARDALGQRPLFYASAGGLTIVASEPQQILAHPSRAAAVNEGVVGEFLTGRAMSVEETVWNGVMRLRPAHVLIASPSGVVRRRYWDFDPESRLDYPRDEEYAEQFASLFDQAIDCRTRDVAAAGGPGVFGVFLSGGLDSSAIAGVAARRARARGVPPIRAFSLTFPGLPMDETPYIDAVTQRWDLPSVRLAARAPSPAEIRQEIDRYRDLPAYPNGAILDPLRRRAAHDVDVVLTGYGGDDWFTGSPLHTADLLRGGELVAAARQIGHDILLPGRGYSAATLLRSAIAPLLSRRARAWLRPVAGGPRPSFPWIRREFAARIDLEARLRPAARLPCRTLVQSEIHAVANSLSQVLGDELEDRAAAAAGIEQRHPFNDRRLAEFGFALPESQRWVKGETKVVLRRALAASLPPLVRARNDKAEFTPTLVQAIDGLGGRDFLSRLRVADAGWVDLAAIQQAYDDMTRLYSRGDEAYIRLADAVWSVAAVELWLNGS